MLEVIDLSNWKTKKEIIAELSLKGIPVNEREIRKEVEHHNELWWNDERDEYIAHSNKGYILTNDAALIMASNEDYKRRAVDMFKKYWKFSKKLNLDVTFPKDLFEVAQDGTQL